MERIDRQQRFSKKATPSAVGDQRTEQPGTPAGVEPASQWLGAAMAMWIQQGEAQWRADHERHSDFSPL